LTNQKRLGNLIHTEKNPATTSSLAKLMAADTDTYFT